MQAFALNPCYDLELLCKCQNQMLLGLDGTCCIEAENGTRQHCRLGFNHHLGCHT